MLLTFLSFQFLSTLSLRRATFARAGRLQIVYYFYPRSPCGERPSRLHKNICGWGFLSTLSLRRATIRAYQRHFPFDISIHALLAESDPETVPCGPHADISIHALLAESDAYGRINDISRLIFLSTLSLRRATTWHSGSRITYVISIHALLAESDSLAGPSGPAISFNFYPRSPCGERPHIRSTLPGRPCISIHALLAESDQRRRTDTKTP